MKTHIGVNGACGRMGQRIIQLAHDDKSLHIVAALEPPGHPHLGRDIGEVVGIGPIGVHVADHVPAEKRIEAMIDFSAPAGTMTVLPLCVDRRIPLVVATTGHTAEEKRQIEAAAHQTAILFSPNLSLVVNILFKLVREAALAVKGKGFDVEIIERHHRFKHDAPSGTALHFARIIQEALADTGNMPLRHGREGIIGERPPNEIGMHSIRAGDNVGEHTIVFSTLGETMELVHKGHTRDAYVRGALQAAKFLAGKGPGRYSMEDVLGL